MFFHSLATFSIGSAPSAALVGIASLVLFAIVGVLVGPDFNNMNITAKDNITKPKG